MPYSIQIFKYLHDENVFLPLNTLKILTIAVPPSRSVQQIPQVTATFVAAYCVCTQLIARFHWQAALINVNASTVVHKGKTRITPTMVASNSIITQLGARKIGTLVDIYTECDGIEDI